MNQRSPVFDQILKDYLSQVADRDWEGLTDPLDAQLLEGRLVIPVFNQRFFIAADGVTNANGAAPSHSVSVLLCRYILQCPEQPPDPGPLVTYKDFKDAAPYVGGFRATAEKPIADHFTGHPDALEQACEGLGGTPFDTDAACQLAICLPALPRVPIYLMFNDQDEEFSADCRLLFRESAKHYLDMECLAIVGGVLAAWLRRMDS